jgi:hypothetical protein
VIAARVIHILLSSVFSLPAVRREFILTVANLAGALWLLYFLPALLDDGCLFLLPLSLDGQHCMLQHIFIESLLDKCCERLHVIISTDKTQLCLILMPVATTRGKCLILFLKIKLNFKKVCK